MFYFPPSCLSPSFSRKLSLTAESTHHLHYKNDCKYAKIPVADSEVQVENEADRGGQILMCCIRVLVDLYVAKQLAPMDEYRVCTC